MQTHRFRVLQSVFFIGFVCSMASATVGSAAEPWPQWRGGNLDGMSRETSLPTKWSKTQGILWSVELPGAAGSTPCVWDDKIFLTTADQGKLSLLCVGTDGKKLWSKVVAEGDKAIRGDEGNLASPSPFTDGKHVWSMMGEGTFACFTVTGEPTWKIDLQERFGKFNIAFGMTSTPVLDGDRIYLQLIHGDGDANTREAVIACLNKETGETIWKNDRPSDAVVECEHSYASPIIYRDTKRAMLITHGADYVIGHSLDDGRELWRCGDLNPKGNYNPTLRFVASPVAGEGIIVVPSAKNGPVFCLKPDISGNITEKADAFVWKMERDTPDVPSPLIHNGLVYLCRENGVIICVDAKTGKLVYEGSATRDRYRASPVIGAGHVYVTSRSGVTTVIKEGRKFEVVASNELGEEVSASPAISNGRIYIRTFSRLYAIGKK